MGSTSPRLLLTRAWPESLLSRRGWRAESRSFLRRHVARAVRITRLIRRVACRISSATTASGRKYRGICAHLDQVDGNPMFDLPVGEQRWEARRLEALARSMLDGLAVWGREITRPQNEQSPTVIRHEADRSRRMADLWEREIDHPLMHGSLNMVQITLACAFDFIARVPDFHWRPGHPKLCDWFAPIAARASIASTAPPAHH